MLHWHQLYNNEMDPYMRGNEPMHLDPSNLMAMRYDLHLAQFNHGTFAVVPKCGELRVHFLQNVDNAGNYYHNTPFTNDQVSHQLLFARFAMQIIKFNKSGSIRGGERSSHRDSGSNDSEIDGGDGIGSRGNGGGGDSGGGGDTSGGDGVDGSGSKHLETHAQRKRREAGKIEDSGKREGSGVEKKRRKVAKKTKDKDVNEDEMEIEDKLDTDAERGL